MSISLMRGGFCRVRFVEAKRNATTLIRCRRNTRHLIPPAMSVTTCVKCYLPEKLIRDSSPGLFWGLVTQAPSACNTPKFYIPGRKAGMQHKPHCLHSLSSVSNSYHLGNGENSPEIQEPRCQLRANLPADGTGSFPSGKGESFQNISEK